MYINTETLEYPVTERQIRDQFPDVSFPAVFSPPAPYQPVLEGPTPAYDPMTEYYVEVAPVQPNGGLWFRAYEVRPLDEKTISANVESLRQQMLASASQICDSLLARLTAKYPEGEVKSWPRQEAEALALTKEGAPAPLLTAIAASRGLTVEDLAARVLIKAPAYAEVSGAIIGKRQTLEDAIERAASLAQLRAININEGWPEVTN